MRFALGGLNIAFLSLLLALAICGLGHIPIQGSFLGFMTLSVIVVLSVLRPVFYFFAGVRFEKRVAAIRREAGFQVERTMSDIQR